MIKWPGLTVVGYSGKVKRGLFYTIETVDVHSVTFTNGVALTFDALVKHCRLCHSLTMASVQGLTLQGRVRVETNSPHFTLRHPYVAISRATGSELVEVC